MITPHNQLIEKIVEIGRAKTSMGFGRLAILAIMAGAFIAMGGMLSVAAGYGFPGITAANPGLQKILSGLTFPIGLFLIVLLGAELFTGNNAVLIPGCASRQFGFGAVMRNWTLVWIFNFAGALAFTYLFVFLSGLTSAEPYRSAVIGIAQAKTALPLHVLFLKGIAANWFVCMAVWIGLMVDSLPAKFLACWIPVGTFVALGYEHSIANMFFIPAGMFEGADVSIAQLFRNLIPVTLGNIVGGAIPVGLAYHCLHARR